MAQETTRNTERRRRFRVPWRVLILLFFLWVNVDLIKAVVNDFDYMLPDAVVQFFGDKGENGDLTKDYHENGMGSGEASMYLVAYDENLIANASKVDVVDYNVSSYLVTSKGNEYPISNCVDGNINTCWQDGVEGFAEGTVMDFYLGEARNLRYIRIRPGRADSDEKFYENGRPQYITINTPTQSFSVCLEDVNSYQMIELTGIYNTDMISIVIDTVYEGSKWEDTCMAEVEFYE